MTPTEPDPHVPEPVDAGEALGPGFPDMPEPPEGVADCGDPDEARPEQ